jgi:hypothetical protein
MLRTQSGKLEALFPQHCTTHTYEDRLQTISYLKKAGIKICSGGIIGMGETREDRCDLAFSLKEVGANVVPINILNPIKGTPFENLAPLPPLEILKTIACFRFILPRREIMIAGGRTVNLRDMQSMVFTAGASALMVGNYLTTLNQPVEKDLQMLKDLGLDPVGPRVRGSIAVCCAAPWQEHRRLSRGNHRHPTVLQQIDQAVAGKNWVRDADFLAYAVRIPAAARRTFIFPPACTATNPPGLWPRCDCCRRTSGPTTPRSGFVPASIRPAFPLNRRENAAGIDLNRDYRHLQSPEVRAHVDWLQRQPRFDVALCLHEDWESNGFYVYELNPDNRPSFAEKILEAAAKSVRWTRRR